MRRVKVLSFERPGLIVRRWPHGDVFTMVYGEILTVERDRRHRLILHTLTNGDLLVRGSRGSLVEEQFRRRGVRVVDCWGALLTPSLADFVEALDQAPERMRQSSDNA